MCLPLDAGTAAAEDAVPPPPPDMPPPPPPDADAMPGPAMPPADYNYDYSAAYGAVSGTDAEQQWCALSNSCPYWAKGLHHGPQWPTVHRHGCSTPVHATSPLLLCLCRYSVNRSRHFLFRAQQGYDASAYGPAALQYDAYGQPVAAYQAAVEVRIAVEVSNSTWLHRILDRWYQLENGEGVHIPELNHTTTVHCARAQATAPALIVHDDVVCIRHGLPVVTYESCCRTRGRSRTPIGS